MEKYFRQDGSKQAARTEEHHFDSEVKAWLFPQALQITKHWLTECVIYKDNVFPQLLLLIELAHDAVDRIYRAIVSSEEGEKILKPRLWDYDQIGSTRHVDFDTTKPVYPTDPAKCHISNVVADTESWEQKLAQSLEDMEEVASYVKNQNLGFAIPYTLNGVERNYIPDFIVRIKDQQGNILNLIIELTGEKRKDKEAKVATARNLWVPAVNNHGGFGKWAFLEVSDPWDVKNTIRRYLKNSLS